MTGIRSTLIHRERVAVASWASQNANAILEAWYPGEEGGAVVAETLAGVNNPAGRLPVTFYKDIADLPQFEDYSMKGRTYRYFTGQPLYPFGYGLSYSKFAYSNVTLSSPTVRAGGQPANRSRHPEHQHRGGRRSGAGLPDIPEDSRSTHPRPARL